MKEKLDHQTLIELGVFSVSIISLIELSRFAFSRGSREEVLRRADYCCEDCGASYTNTPLEAAHIDHSRDNPEYDNPDNGRALCVLDHLKDHIQRAGSNGLSNRHNNWAIKSLIERAKSLGYDIQDIRQTR